MKNRGSTFIQTGAAALSMTMLWTAIVPPFAEASLWSERRQAVQEMQVQRERKSAVAPSFKSFSKESGRKDPFDIPESAGSVVEVWTQKSSPVRIIHIQDAHGH